MAKKVKIQYVGDILGLKAEGLITNKEARKLLGLKTKKKGD